MLAIRNLMGLSDHRRSHRPMSDYGRGGFPCHLGFQAPVTYDLKLLLLGEIGPPNVIRCIHILILSMVTNFVKHNGPERDGRSKGFPTAGPMLSIISQLPHQSAVIPAGQGRMTRTMLLWMVIAVKLYTISASLHASLRSTATHSLPALL